MSFYEYCVEIANVPYYNFLTEEEYDALHEKYEEYLETLG